MEKDDVTWRRYQAPVLWLLGLVVVLRVGFMLVTPAQQPAGPSPAAPAATAAPTAGVSAGCPPMAPNAAAGCLLIGTP